ncbi:MAG: TIGR01212 family radical SAM protein [Bacteroidales bacterium]|nr:TIGR01212 family radical SAM protein [Bacteroidales bacterium]
MRYYTQNQYFREHFGTRVQKLSVDGGFTCPNCDGATGSIVGCSFCNNAAFVPSYCQPSKTIASQIEEGIAFHRHRCRTSPLYLVYFQTYSNTYASVDTLRERYLQALQHPSVVGLIVATRPDCINEENLALLCELSKSHYVAVELGIESCYDSTLIAINRGHDVACAFRAVRLVASYGLPVGGHFILGLPGESRTDILKGVGQINQLPLTSVKFHQLQILRGTTMEHQYLTDEQFRNSLLLLSLPTYISLLCDIIERLRPDLVVERLASEVPPRYQAVAERAFRRADGRWIRNEDIPPLVDAELARRGTHQGSKLHILNSK